MDSSLFNFELISFSHVRISALCTNDFVVIHFTGTIPTCFNMVLKFNRYYVLMNHRLWMNDYAIKYNRLYNFHIAVAVISKHECFPVIVVVSQTFFIVRAVESNTAFSVACGP